MSRFITAIVIFSLLLTGCIGSVIYISRHTRDLQHHLETIIDSAEADDFEKAFLLANEFVSQWEIDERNIVMLVRHHSVDEISKFAAKLPSYAQYQNKSELIALTNQIYAILEHVREDELPLFHNLL